MTFLRCSLFTLCLTAMLGFVAPRIVPAPQVHAQQTAPQTPPPSDNAPQAYKLSPDKEAKAIAISRIRNIMDIVGGLWGLAVLWLLLSTRAAAGLEAWAKSISARRWIQGLIFFATFLLITAVANVPLDWFSHMEERNYNVSVQGWGSWLGDEGKSALLGMVLGSLVMLLFNWIVRRWPRRYWFGIWLVTLPLLIFSIFISPYLAPIFNKFEPLSKNHAPLVAKLETVVARTGIGIPPERMFLMKASEKYNGLNAYVTGIGSTKRYVMWDTATDRLPDDEILFVFGHESGHYVLNHIPKLIAGTWAALFFIFLGCAGFAAWLARRYGNRWGLGEPGNDSPLASRAGFIVLLFTISVAGFVLEPVNNTFSRHFEHQADVYGQEAIHGLVPDPQKTAVSAFNHLGESWLEDPDPSPFIEFWEYNHPSVQTRANFAERYDPWANGGHGEFFDK
jgi:Zn-dependent protease with chaperone function